MVRLLKEPRLRNRLGAAGLARVSSEYNSNQNAKRLLALLNFEIQPQTTPELVMESRS